MKISLIELTTPDTSAMGVRSLSAYLKQAGHNIQIIFLGSYIKKDKLNNTPYPDYVLDQIVSLCNKSEIVGISFLSSGFY